MIRCYRKYRVVVQIKINALDTIVREPPPIMALGAMVCQIAQEALLFQQITTIQDHHYKPDS